MLCNAPGIQYYSTNNETKVAFGERTKQSKKHFSVLWRTMNTNTFSSYRSLLKLWTLERIVPLVWNQNYSKTPVSLSILYCKHPWEYRKRKFKIGDGLRISKFDLLFRKRYKPLFTQANFEFVAIVFRKPATYTNEDDQDGTIRGKFYQKALIKVI